MTLPTTDAPPSAEPVAAAVLPSRQIATLSLLLLVLIVFLLEKFRTILEPLFIGVFIAYVILPIHAWLVRRGIGPLYAYVTLLLLLLLVLVGVGTLAFVNG